MSRLTSLVIGDIHFKSSSLDRGDELVDRLTKLAQERSPTFIVLLGDILDTHEVVRVQCHALAVKLLENLSKVCDTYLLIGNHDYINNSQFLSENHVFTPFKRWEGLTIVDKPICVDYLDQNEDTRTFFFSPYVPAGRFYEALDTSITEGYAWDIADCIFAHQEMKGCFDFPKAGLEEWDESYPPIISGHIHDERTVGANLFYTGSCIQHNFDESPEKFVWMIDWDFCDAENEEDPFAPFGFSVEKIDLGLKRKATIDLTLEQLKKLRKRSAFRKELDSNHVKINLSIPESELKIFRNSAEYEELKKKAVVRFVKEKVAPCDLPQSERKLISFSYNDLLKELVSNASLGVKNEYESILGTD